KSILKVGNAQGFWGDKIDAPFRLISQQPDLDYLTMDYLAEVSMAVLVKQREKKSASGFASDFLDVVRSLAPLWAKGGAFKVVVNAGGLNPLGCARAVAELLRNLGLKKMKIGVVFGDDVLHILKGSDAFVNLDTGEPQKNIASNIMSANA